MPRTRSASASTGDRAARPGGGGGAATTAWARRVASCSISCTAGSTVGVCRTMISERPSRTTSPGTSATRRVSATPLTVVPLRLPRSTTDSAVGLGTSRRCCLDTRSSASIAPVQSRPTTIGRLSTRRRAGRPHSRISIRGGPATSDLLAQQTASVVGLQLVIVELGERIVKQMP